MKTAWIGLAVIWASLAFGVGYNTWRAHQAIYDAKAVDQRVDFNTRRIDGLYEETKELSRRIHEARAYSDSRLKEAMSRGTDAK